MLIFDLREEARMASYLYVVLAAAIGFFAVWVAPRSFRARMPDAVAEAVGPLALLLGLAAAALGWQEYDERREADELVEMCLNGGCAMAEGAAYDVEPVHRITSGSRYTAPLRGGYFKLDDKLFAHYPRDASNYSPANVLRDGDWVRVYSQDGRLVLVEVAE
jgi:hypothetical protein